MADWRDWVAVILGIIFAIIASAISFYEQANGPLF